MSSQKAATVPGIQLQVPNDISGNEQNVTDSSGNKSPLKLSTSAVVVDISGKLGIGGTPNFPLHVGLDKSVRFDLGPTANFQIGGNGEFYVDAPNIPKGRFLVSNSGRVGINQPNPQAQLDVNGTIRAGGLTFTGELAVPGMKPETSAPPGAKLEAVYIDKNTGILYYHNHP